MNEENIDGFVIGISDAALTKLFKHYNLGLYDHLLQNQRKTTSKCEERQALRAFFWFIVNNGESERRTKMTPCVQAKDETMLLDLMCEDQFFEEPLMHVINKRVDFNTCPLPSD